MDTSATPRPTRTAVGSRRRAGVLNSSRMSDTTFVYLLIVPVAIVLLAIIIYPTLYSLYTSLFNINAVFGIREFTWFDNYVDALRSPETWRAIRLTIAYVFWVTIFSLVVGLFGALLLNEAFKGRGLLIALVILPWAVSTYAAAVVWRFMYSEQFGMVNTILMGLGLDRFNLITETSVLPAIAIAHTWQFAPLGIYFMLATLQIIPSDLYNLAKTDRLHVFGRFRYVTLPYLRGPILIFLVLVTAEAARAFDIIFFISGGGPGGASHTLSFQIYQDTFVNLNLGYGAAVSWILIIMITGITLAYFWAILGREREEEVLEIDEEEKVWKQKGLIGLADASEPGRM